MRKLSLSSSHTFLIISLSRSRRPKLREASNGRTTFFQVPHPKKRGSLCLSRTFSSDFVIGDAAAPPATSDAGITPRARAPLISCPRARDCSGLEFLDATGPGTVLCLLPTMQRIEARCRANLAKNCYNLQTLKVRRKKHIIRDVTISEIRQIMLWMKLTSKKRSN